MASPHLLVSCSGTLLPMSTELCSGAFSLARAPSLSLSPPHPLFPLFAARQHLASARLAPPRAPLGPQAHSIKKADPSGKAKSTTPRETRCRFLSLCQDISHTRAPPPHITHGGRGPSSRSDRRDHQKPEGVRSHPPIVNTHAPSHMGMPRHLTGYTLTRIYTSEPPAGPLAFAGGPGVNVRSSVCEKVSKNSAAGVVERFDSWPSSEVEPETVPDCGRLRPEPRL